MTWKLSRTATILVLCLSLGLQWVALQSFAWATMLIENARHAPLSEAVAKTFDGAHPCDLCHAIAAGGKTGKKSDLLPVTFKIDLICDSYLLTYPPPWSPYAYPRVAGACTFEFQSPPVPPPRSLLS